MTVLVPFLPQNFLLCDFDSGICDLHGYLLKCGVEHRYTEIEIVPEVREMTLIEYPDIENLGSSWMINLLQHTMLSLQGVFN
jgi:hypothetical protein